MNLSKKQKLFLQVFLCLCISCLFLSFAIQRQPVGCFSILSLKNGKKVTIQPKSYHQLLCYLDAWCDKDTFFLIEGNRDMNLCYIMQYNMQGKKLSEYKLPVFSYLIQGNEKCIPCAFYPVQKRFFYVEEETWARERLYYYDLDSGEKGMIVGVEANDEIKNVRVVNETLLLVDAYDSSKKTLYLIDIEEKKLVATWESTDDGWCGVDISLNVSLSRLAVFPVKSNNIDVYDSSTLQHLFSIPKNPMANCFAFSPSGNIILKLFYGDSKISFAVEDIFRKTSEIIFSVPVENYSIFDMQFYSDEIILIHLGEYNKKYAQDWLQHKYAVEQLWLFDLREKKIIQKYPVSVRNYSKIQGDYWIWEDNSREWLLLFTNCRLLNILFDFSKRFIDEYFSWSVEVN